MKRFAGNRLNLYLWLGVLFCCTVSNWQLSKWCWPFDFSWNQENLKHTDFVQFIHFIFLVINNYNWMCSSLSSLLFPFFCFFVFLLWYGFPFYFVQSNSLLRNNNANSCPAGFTRYSGEHDNTCCMQGLTTEP
jgi:hypothetical protein